MTNEQQQFFEPPTHHARNTDPQTSHDAAWMNPGARNTQRQRLARAFFEAYPRSLNWDEAAAIAGIPTKSSPWRRITELKERGIIEKTGISITSSGAMATAYCITPAGNAVMSMADVEIYSPDVPLAGE